MSGHQFTILPSFLAPPISYFAQIVESQMVVIYDNEIYRKQSLRNHFNILTSHGKLMITFPVQKPWRDKALNEVKLDLNQKWIANHWKSIKTAYGKAPFFEIYAPLFENILRNPPEMLIELNMKVLELCMQSMKLSKPVVRFSQLETDALTQDELTAQLADAKYWDNEFGKGDDELSYNQLFGNEFVKGLSTLDLLFNHGPESLLYIRKS